MHDPTDLAALAMQIARHFAHLPSVVAIALAGSAGAGAADAHSDLDLYIYADVALPLEERQWIAAQYADRYEIDNRFWEPGDEWMTRATEIGIDIMYRTPGWIEDQLERVLIRHEASVGYSTCFWFNIQQATVLFDRDGWYARLQSRAAQEYPEALRRAIIAQNHPILRRTLSSYLHQLTLAVKRHDLVSMNHRVAAMLASYFDILFAINRQPHPGEKRVLTYAQQHCHLVPKHMVDDVEELVCSLNAMDEHTLLAAARNLLDRLDLLLIAENLVELD